MNVFFIIQLWCERPCLYDVNFQYPQDATAWALTENWVTTGWQQFLDYSHCPTRFNSTQLVLNMFRTPRLAKKLAIFSRVELGRKSVHTASDSVNTLTTRLNSTQLNCQLSWVESGSVNGALGANFSSLSQFLPCCNYLWCLDLPDPHI